LMAIVLGFVFGCLGTIDSANRSIERSRYFGG
jgi:hypothetical protein